MIENPKVGQRVWRLTVDFHRSKIRSVFPGIVILNGRLETVDNSDLFDSPASASAALRAEAQRLLDAADKLDEEAEHDAETEANRIADREAMGDELESEASE